MPNPTVYTFPSEDVPNVAGHLLVDLLVNSSEPKLLLLSGGSAIKSYQGLSRAVNMGQISQLSVGLIDERFGPVGHAHSNEKTIDQQTKLLAELRLKGLEFNPMLTGSDIDDEVSRYQSWIQRKLDSCPIQIGVLGVGIDGHTAGMLPDGDAKRFEQQFDQPEEYITGYRSNDIYRQRITSTMTLLRSLTHVIVVAGGDGKSQIIRKALAYPIAQKNEVPATILQELHHVTIFTSD